MQVKLDFKKLFFVYSMRKTQKKFIHRDISFKTYEETLNIIEISYYFMFHMKSELINLLKWNSYMKFCALISSQRKNWGCCFFQLVWYKRFRANIMQNIRYLRFNLQKRCAKKLFQYQKKILGVIKWRPKSGNSIYQNLWMKTRKNPLTKAFCSTLLNYKKNPKPNPLNNFYSK